MQAATQIQITLKMESKIGQGGMLGPRSPSCWYREDTGQESVDDEDWLLLGASSVVLSHRVYATTKKNAALC